MIIEFFGLPGGGKTYYAEKFAREHELPLIEIHSRPQRYFWALIFACARPRTFFFFLKEIVKENRRHKRLLRHKIHNLYLRAIAKEGKSFFERDAVIDEGLSQVLLYLFERRIQKSELAPLSFLFQRRMVHIVVASADMRNERMRSRGRVPRAFLSNAYSGRWFSLYILLKDAYRDRWFPVLEHNFDVITVWIKENLPYREIHNG